MSTRGKTTWAVAVVLLVASAGYGNWIETFDGGASTVPTWQFLSWPQVAGTFDQPILEGPESNYYMAMVEPSSIAVGGGAFGAGFGSEEAFTDVRVGAVVNVVGDASHAHHGLLARANYFVDDGSLSGYPGVVASCYVMHVNWENGPANLMIDIEKVVMLQNIMDTGDFDIANPSLDNARSFYAELDVVGTDPTYVTGSLYEYQGGPLVVRTPTLVDTSGNDYWEDDGVLDEPFQMGPSGIFAQNENAEPAGFYTTWDDISSLSDGPSAVAVYPVNGAKEVSPLGTLIWQEARFATGRELWLGKPGQMERVDPAPTGTTYTLENLELGQVYEWRVDQVGPNGTVTGHTRRFTTDTALPVEYFETYADTDEITATWVHNIGAEYWYIFLETGTVNQGGKAMRFEYENQYTPFYTEATRTFAVAQDWTVTDPEMLSLMFRGDRDNVEQRFYVTLEDAAGNRATVDNPFRFAVQSERWRCWDIDLAGFAGVDLSSVKKLIIGVGEGADSGQGEARNGIIIDRICLK